MINASLLDRLIDNQPDKIVEAVKSRHQQLVELHASVCRDLENLLNTRRPELQWPREWAQLDQSLVSYGIPDITGRMLDTSEAQEKLCAELCAVINYFETRLKNIKVKLLQTDKMQDRTLRLRIEALLIVEHAPELVVFDSILEPGTSSFQVVEAMDER